MPPRHAVSRVNIATRPLLEQHADATNVHALTAQAQTSPPSTHVTRLGTAKEEEAKT